MRRLPARLIAPDRRTLLTGVAALGLSAGISGCGPSEPPVDESGRVRLRLAIDDRPGAGHGGFYQALATGLYEKRGLNVQMVRPGFNQDVPRALASGQADLGLASDSFVPLRLVEEEAPVKAVAAFFQTSPRALISHPDGQADTGISGLSRPIRIQVADTDRDTFWPWLKTTAGYTDDQLADFDLRAFKDDPRAILLGDVTQLPTMAAHEDASPLSIQLLAEQGLASYGAMVLAPNAFARDNDDALRAFIAASVEGWASYIDEDPAPAHALIRRANRALTPELLDQARTALRDKAIVAGADPASTPVGTMAAHRWRSFYESTVEAGIFPAGLDWQQAFTTDYLSPPATPAAAS
jgi:NitT/TauT family transport system substrate-binding protein